MASVDPVTGEYPLSLRDGVVQLRMTNSAYAYIEQEAGVECAHDAISVVLDGAMRGQVVFSKVIPVGRALLRAAKIDPDRVDEANRNELVGAVVALLLSTIDTTAASENPPKAGAA